MKIKTIKIKAEKDTRDFVISDFYIPHSTIYSTTSKLIKENKEYYWLVLIAYESNVPLVSGPFSTENQEQLPQGYKETIAQYISNSNTNSQRVKSRMYSYLENLHMIHSMNDFSHIRGLGKKTIEEDRIFFTGLLKLINKCKLENRI